jgi:hypothetical protein
MITRDGNQLDSYYQRSQTGSTLFLCRNTRFPVQCGTSLYVGDISFSADAATHQLAVAGKAIISEGLTTSSVTAETLTVLTPSVGTNSVTACELGTSFSFLRLIHGHHLDCYSRGSNAPRVLYLNHYANAGVRCPRLGIGGDPSDVHLDVRGAGRFSGAVTATSFPSSSDERLKDDIVDASLAECTRLLLAIRPKTYVLKNTGKEQLGYVAQDWQREALPAYRNSIVGEALGEEQMLALDYSRVCPILHGALLSALARIEALESRLQ